MHRPRITAPISGSVVLVAITVSVFTLSWSSGPLLGVIVSVALWNVVNSLRDLLGAQPDPEFELSLPKGWERLDATVESQTLIERRLGRFGVLKYSVDVAPRH